MKWAAAVILVPMLVAALGACGSAPTRSGPPPPIPREPVLTMKHGRLVSSLRVGDTQIFPYACDGSPLPALCTDVGTDIREKGCELYLVDRNDEGDIHQLMFSAECSGNTMCGSFGFWLLIVSPEEIQVSPPINGCFTVGDTHGSMDWQSWTFTPPPGLASKSFPRRYDPTMNRWR